FPLFFFYCSGDVRDLLSFPTRRSSDLAVTGHCFDLLIRRSSLCHASRSSLSMTMCGAMWKSGFITFSTELAAYSFVWIFVSPLRSEEHTSELQSRENLVCRLLLEKKK